MSNLKERTETRKPGDAQMISIRFLGEMLVGIEGCPCGEDDTFIALLERNGTMKTVCLNCSREYKTNYSIHPGENGTSEITFDGVPYTNIGGEGIVNFRQVPNLR